ncbi:hypothetical protein T492DRAFT_855077, partial [Pavlovales sp. CCMP2436]
MQSVEVCKGHQQLRPRRLRAGPYLRAGCAFTAITLVVALSSAHARFAGRATAYELQPVRVRGTAAAVPARLGEEPGARADTVAKEPGALASSNRSSAPALDAEVGLSAMGSGEEGQESSMAESSMAAALIPESQGDRLRSEDHRPSSETPKSICESYFNVTYPT